MQAGRPVAIGPVAEVFAQYDTMVHSGRPVLTIEVAETNSASSTQTQQMRVLMKLMRWRLPRTKHSRVRVKLMVWKPPQTPPRVGPLEGNPCERPQIHLLFRLCLRYRLLKDSPYRMIPGFHLFDEQKSHVLISTPAELAPSSQGDYAACCLIEPFVLNTGRYAIGLGLGTNELPQPVHFYADCALRFEVVEPAGVDPRRHSYHGDFPGATRLRLEWQYLALDPCELAREPGKLVDHPDASR